VVFLVLGSRHQQYESSWFIQTLWWWAEEGSVHHQLHWTDPNWEG